MSKRHKNKQQETKKRLDVIQSWMSSFAVTVVAVVAAVIFIPASPKGEIIKTVELYDQITYQVFVTDEDEALDLSTLCVVLENSMEYYEHSITLGESSGYFSELTPNTFYRLSIYGSKGFGQERLDTMRVKTKETIGGIILGYERVGDLFNSTYFVDVGIYDPEHTYQSISLYYGYVYGDDIPIVYDQYDILSSFETVEIIESHESYPLDLYLEAITIEGTEILDRLRIVPPFELSAFADVMRLNKDAFYFYIYPDFELMDEVTYQASIYRNQILFDQFDISSIEEIHDMYGYFDSLKEDTTYDLVITANYQNPITLRPEQTIIYDRPVTTLKAYEYTIDIINLGTSLEITLAVTDPEHYFQIPYVEIRNDLSNFSSYYDYISSDFIPNGETKSVTFTIDLLIDQPTYITVGMKNDTDSKINQIVLETRYE